MNHDEPCSEMLLEHMSLEDVLAFVVARDDVRRMCVPVVEREEEGGFVPTMRVVSSVEDA